MSKDLKDFFNSFSETEDQLNFRMANEVVERVPAISTGSLVLDDALSSGGLPKGRLIQFYGPAGSGKTLMAMIGIKQAQMEDPEAQQLFIDAEQTFNFEWAKTLGINLKKLGIYDNEDASNGKRCFEMLLGVPKEDSKTHMYAGKKKEGLLDKIANGDININLIVLDSLGAIIPPGEDVASVGKVTMTTMARFLTPTFKKLSLEVSKAKIPFIIINHKRDSLDPYGPDHTFSGGNTYAHSLSANIYFEAVGRKDAAILDAKEQKIGHTIRATIEKSKFGPWPRKCEFKVNFGIGVVDVHEEIAKLSLDYDIVSKPTNVSHEYNEQKWVGYPKFCEAIRDNQDLANELAAKIKQAREDRLVKQLADIEAEPSSESAQEDDTKSKRSKKAK